MADHTVEITVGEENNRKRLDSFLASQIADMSRSKMQQVINASGVSRDGAPVTACDTQVKTGEVYTVNMPEATPMDLVPTEIPLDIVYEDEDVLVINKQSGLTVHPGAGNHQDTLVNALLYYYKSGLSKVGGAERPGIVHRLDRDTSGLMIVARNDRAHRILGKQLEKRTLKRTYHALIWGALNPREGTIEGNIGRSPINRKKMALVKEGGRAATTHYKTLEIMQDGLVSLVECRLQTGRTHQIRVHLASKGHSVIGDPLYGGRRSSTKSSLPENIQEAIDQFPRQALHAVGITFRHPTMQKDMSFESDYPGDIQKLMEALQ